VTWVGAGATMPMDLNGHVAVGAASQWEAVSAKRRSLARALPLTDGIDRPKSFCLNGRNECQPQMVLVNRGGQLLNELFQVWQLRA
jgi:hypothetical protein